MEEPREAPKVRPSLRRETIAQRTARTIDEAARDGFFDNLPGSGRPLDLSDDDNPFVPEDMRLAYRILRNAGYSLPWIELRKDIEAQVVALERQIASHASRLRSSAAGIRRFPPYLQPNRFAQLNSLHQQFLVEHARLVTDLNRKIDDFNLSVPVTSLQLRRVNSRSSLAPVEAVLPDELRGDP